MIISSKNTLIKETIKLKQKKYREQTQSYLVEGEHLVEEAKKAEVIECVFSTKDVAMDVPVHIVNEEVMKKLAFTKTPQSIMAKCKMKLHQEIKGGNRYLILDNLQDPGNVGTLVRSALALGISQVILSKHCVDLYNDKVLRSMQGAHFHISCLVTDLEKILPSLQKEGIFVLGSALEGGKDISSISVQEKMAFVVGNEGNGMRKEIIDMCDGIGYIPITQIDSLNVAVAGSIMMHHFRT